MIFVTITALPLDCFSTAVSLTHTYPYYPVNRRAYEWPSYGAAVERKERVSYCGLGPPGACEAYRAAMQESLI